MKKRDKLTAFWVSLSTTDRLLAIAIALGGSILVWQLWDRLSAPLTLHETANAFASELRIIQAKARERHSFITVECRRRHDGLQAGYCVVGTAGYRAESDFPPGIIAVGKATFDPQGVPSASNKFILRKGEQRASILVDEKGLVRVPLEP